MGPLHAAKQVQPRVLADGLMVMATGPAHAARIEEAVGETHGMLTGMGARISAGKSCCFSTSETMREWLK